MSGTGVCSWGQVTFPLDPSVNRGLNTRFNSCTGGVVDPNPLPNPTTGYDSTTVSGGPNNGLWYVTAAYYEMNRGSSINPYFTDSLPKYALTGNDKKNCGDAVSFNEYNACKGHSLQPMFTGLWNHEEYGTNPAPPEPNGHQSRYELAAGQADDDPYKTVEELVATDTTQLQFSVRDAIIAIDNRIFPFADDHDHVRDNFVNGNKCGKVWLYNTNTNKFVFKELKGENNSCI